MGEEKSDLKFCPMVQCRENRVKHKENIRYGDWCTCHCKRVCVFWQPSGHFVFILLVQLLQTHLTNRLFQSAGINKVKQSESHHFYCCRTVGDKQIL